MITITENAKKELAESLAKIGGEVDKTTYLRIAVKPGGCAGFQYEFSAVNKDELNVDDTIYNNLIVVDEKSITVLKGSIIDYVSDPIQGGGISISNPQAKGGCGCGKSFCS